MSNTCEIVKSHLINNVKDLIVNLGVSHKEIIKGIHDAVIELGNSLPKIQVLYNNTYGGYGLSEEFIEYVRQYEPELNKSLSDNKEYRIKTVQYILPFGHYVLQKYPVFKDLLVIYHHYNLNKIFDNISSSYYLEDRLQSLYKRKTQLEKILDNEYSHGTKTPKKYVLNDDDDDASDVDVNIVTIHDFVGNNYVRLEGYTKETYEEAIETINKEIDTNLSTIDKYKSSTISEDYLTEVVYDDMKQIIYSLIKDEDRHFKDKYYISLLGAINKFGVDDHRIWEFQNMYNKRALQYLFIKSKDYIPQDTKEHHVYDFVFSNTYIEINDKDYNNIVKEFGLVCASSRYCALKIGEVSQYVSWYIGEYDGLERICLQ
jgi:DNA-binding ferritin-like protein (Dps family)